MTFEHVCSAKTQICKNTQQYVMSEEITELKYEKCTFGHVHPMETLISQYTPAGSVSSVHLKKIWILGCPNRPIEDSDQTVLIAD